MAISYNNLFKDNVIDSLEAILKNEFPQIPVVYGNQSALRGTQWFRLIPLTDTTEELEVDGESRRYALTLKYLVMIGGREDKATHVNRLTAMGEHVKRLLNNNRNYKPSGTYKYHNLLVNTVDYTADTLEDDEKEDLSAVSWNLEVSVGETF